MARIVTGRRMIVRDAEDCINFDGGRVDVSPCPNFNITEFSISFWANTFVQGGAYSGYRDWISFQGASGGIGSIEVFNSPDPKGSVNFAKISGFTGANSVNGSKNIINTGWRRITMTASKTDNSAKIYIDGVLEASAAWNPSSEAITSFRIGARINDSSRSIKARMTHIRVYNRRLSASEVLDEHYSEIIQRGNLAMEILFREASGTTVNDTSGNSIIGTINASVADWSLLGPMKLRAQATNRVLVRDFGGSTLFDGVSSVIQILNQPIYNLVNYSVSFWIKSVMQNDDKYFISNARSSTTTPMWGLSYKRPSGNFYNLRIFIRDDSNNVLSMGSGDITPQNLVHGRWYHVTITDAGGSIKCYVNGVYQGINPTYTRGTLTLDQTSFGALWRTFVVNDWAGKLDNVKIYNKALSAEEALKLFLSGNAGVNPIANYPLNDTPPTYVDSIGGKNGTGISTTKSTDVPMKARVAV